MPNRVKQHAPNVNQLMAGTGLFTLQVLPSPDSQNQEPNRNGQGAWFFCHNSLVLDPLVQGKSYPEHGPGD